MSNEYADFEEPFRTAMYNLQCNEEIQTDKFEETLVYYFKCAFALANSP